MTQRRWWLPSLWYTHFTFAIIYFVVALHHLGMGISQTFHSERYESATYEYVYDLLPMEGWGVMHLAIWGIMTLGAYYKFLTWGRLGLALGLLLSLYRGLALQISPTGGGALIVWIVVAGTHFVQLMEPPRNPLTAKE